MIRPGSDRNPDAPQIVRIALEVARRRKALGLTQDELDHACGFVVATAYSIERGAVNLRRSLPPTDPRVARTIETLARLESDPELVARSRHQKTVRKAERAPRRALKPRTKAPIHLSATLKLCPEMSAWITQGGCDGIRKIHPTCKARRFGLGCRGVRYRRGLETKEIAVDYTPPSPGEESPRKLRPEDWT